MDATRTAKRLGAASVICLYRRRVEDMTALPEEISAAMAEGCEIRPLEAPDHIEKDGDGKVATLWTRPQIIGKYGHDGRPRPGNAATDLTRIPCDYVIVAIGQSIVTKPFEQIGVATDHGAIKAERSSAVPGLNNIFAGGDAVSGPATVIEPLPREKSRRPISTHFSALTTRFRSISRFRRPTLQTRRPADASISSITEDLTVPVTSACL